MSPSRLLPARVIGELRRRHVFRVAVLYAVVGWAVASGADYLLGLADAPLVVSRIVAILIVIGFPLSLVLAWAYELTPDGISRTGEHTSVKVAGPESGASRPAVQTAAPRAPSHAAKSLVVLPFTNLSPDPEDAYFSDGLTEELITDLSGISQLRVISSASAFRLKGTDKDLRTVGSDLGVSHALSGRVRKDDERVRITAQLIDVRDGSLIWGEKYSGSLANAFDLQEQVSRAIAHALHVQLQPPSVAPNAQAVEAYLKGRHFFRQATTDGLNRAVDSFRAAAELDPNYAPAHAGLAYALVHLTAGWSALPASETMPPAEAAARRAIELDPTLPEAHVAYALVATYHHFDLAGAEAAFEEALHLNADYADAHGWYTAPLIWLDTRFAQALDHARRAVELSPVDPWAHFQLAWTHYFSRDYFSAIEQAQRLTALEPLWSMGHYFLGLARATAGHPDEAIADLTRAVELDGRVVHNIAWLGLSHALAGRKREAYACLSELDEQERQGKSVWAWKLVVHSGLKEADAVMRCLEQAVQERSAALLYHLTHPLVDCVRSYPQFQELLRKLNIEHLVAYSPAPPWSPETASVGRQD